MKVLVIEDDREIVEFVRLAFEISEPGIELVSTSLGEEGVEMAESQSPDAVILDLGLSDIDGWEVLKRIRHFSKVPIVIMTVRKGENDLKKGLDLGADKYIIKPFEQAELLDGIRALVKGK